MVTPDEIKKTAFNKYGEYLKCKYVNRGETFFPLVIRCNKDMSSFSSLKELEKGMNLLIFASKFKKKLGYTLHTTERKTKEFGTQTVPSSITIDSELDFLTFIGMRSESQRFDTIITKTLYELPELKDIIINKYSLVVKYYDVWDDILKVCRFFRFNHKPDMYVRELPIGVHTKFIEKSKGVLRPLLDVIVGDDANKEETDFYLRFNLKNGEPEISFRILDKELSDKYFSGLTYIRTYINEFAKLNIPVKNIIITENLRNTNKVMELFPNSKSTMVIWGSGYGVTVLKEVSWLKDMNLYYWGDIDAQGYEILSDIRQYFPAIESIMMDEEAIIVHPNNKDENKVNGTVSNVTKQLHLHAYENKVYEFVKENNLRYEQELLPSSYMRKCLDKIL